MQSKIIKHGGKNVNPNGNAAHGRLYEGSKHDITDTKSPGDRHECKHEGWPDRQEGRHACFLEDKVHAKDDSIFYGARDGCIFDRLGATPCSRHEGKHENLDGKSGLGNSSIDDMHRNWDERHRQGHSQEFRYESGSGPRHGCGRGISNAEEVKALSRSVENQSKCGGGVYRGERRFSGGERRGFRGGDGGCGFRGVDSESGPAPECEGGRFNVEEVKTLLKSVESQGSLALRTVARNVYNQSCIAGPLSSVQVHR